MIAVGNIKIDADIVAQLRDIATEQLRSFPAQINYALREWLAQRAASLPTSPAEPSPPAPQPPDSA
jgi:hypothetical protein